MSGWAATVAWVAVVAVYAALSSVWTARDPGWCAGLAKPSFQPPDAVFRIMWPLNFLALFAVGVWFTRSSAAEAVWPTTAVLVPYGAWLSIATALSVQYVRLDPRQA